MTDPWELANSEANRLYAGSARLSDNTMNALLNIVLKGQSGNEANLEVAKALIGQAGNLPGAIGGENYARWVSTILGGAPIDTGYAAGADTRRIAEERGKAVGAGASAVGSLGSAGLRLPPGTERALFGDNLGDYVSQKDREKMQSEERQASIRTNGNGEDKNKTVITTVRDPVTGEAVGYPQEQRTVYGSSQPPVPVRSAPSPSSSSFDANKINQVVRRVHGDEAMWGGAVINKKTGNLDHIIFVPGLSLPVTYTDKEMNDLLNKK